MSYQLIQTDQGVAQLVRGLRAGSVTRLAIDVEGENNLHRYGIHVALIQLFDGTHGWIVDPLALTSSACLRPLLEEAPWELIWFDAGNDLLSFQHALGIRPSPILDLVVAARLLGRTGGLHEMTGTGGSARAKDRFQRANWLRRPLSPALLDYAISDVLHLHELADTLLAELQQKGLEEKFRIKNLETQNARRTWDPFANFVRVPGFNRFSAADRRAARVLWHARELYGRDHDMPPGNVASKQELGLLVTRGQRTGAEIAAFLNEKRQKNLVVPAELARCLADAEKQVPSA